MQHLVIIEKGPTSFGAYVPDLPGCMAVGETRSEVTKLIHEAIEFHLEGMQEDGLSVPEPLSSSELIEAHAKRKYPPAKPGALICEPLKAAKRGR